MSLEKKIIHLLKLEGPLSSNEIAVKLNVSKSCAYSHISALEDRDFLKKRLFKTKVGRPGYKFILTETGVNSFNDEGCYVNELLNFMIKTDNRDILKSFLENMYTSVARKYESALIPGNVKDRAKQLVSLRQSDGYMATLFNGSEEELRIEQANCPIYRMAKLDHSACELERSMFMDLLGKEVNISKRQILGSGVCRFHIKTR